MTVAVATNSLIAILISGNLDIVHRYTCGLFYGAQTLTQLMPPEVVGKEKLEGDITVPSLQINDKPRFQWRGYMKDVSRTFYSVDVLKKYIDIMSLYKMNTLHLHLTDDQGWRVEIKKYPRLTSEKATHYPVQFGQPEGRSGFYTQEELKDLVAYAAARHVQIVPEIDVPGHCWPVLINYPELAVNDSFYPDYVMPFCETYHVWGHQFTPNTLDPSNEKVYQFLDDVFTEIAAIFPSEYIHFGGDEVRHILWEKNEHIQNFMKEKGMKNVMELQIYFVTRVSAIIAGKGKSEGESTHQNHYFEDIYLAPMQYLHQYGEEYKETGYQQCGIVVYPLLVFRGHE